MPPEIVDLNDYQWRMASPRRGEERQVQEAIQHYTTLLPIRSWKVLPGTCPMEAGSAPGCFAEWFKQTAYEELLTRKSEWWISPLALLRMKWKISSADFW
jgi:hypothetical protein